MLNEALGTPSHDEAKIMIADHMRAKGGVVRSELVLPDGKIADVAWSDPFDDLFIFEVKTVYKHSLAINAWEKYGRWCDYLFLVIPGLTAMDWPRWRFEHQAHFFSNRVAVMGIDHCGTYVYHPPRQTGLIAENRLQMLQRLLTPAGR